MVRSPKRLVVFSSAGPGNLRAVHELALERPDLMELALLVTDRPNIPALDYAAAQGISAITKDFAAALERRPADTRAEVCEMLHDEILCEIKIFEAKSGPIDLCVLAYRRVVTGRLFEYFRGRAINQHPADLTVLDCTSRARRYVGIGGLGRSLADAVPDTRTSTIFVSEKVDAGEILVQGPVLATRGGRETLKPHEEQQKVVSDWPALRLALTLLCEDRVGITSEKWPDGAHVLTLDGVSLPYGGVQL